MIWHYPTLKDDGWHPYKDNAWPVSGAYHILQMKEIPNSLTGSTTCTRSGA